MFEPIVRRALEEDLRWGDVTSESLIPRDTLARAAVVARQDGVVCGIPVAASVFEMVDPRVGVTELARDGEPVRSGARLMSMEGPARSLLAAERVALNFVQRLSGIATLTARYVEAVEGTGARIADTRKTTPGLRLLEKYAVRCGGGANHRWSLGDAVLVKDNHLAALAAAGIALGDAIRAAREALPHVVYIQVEVDTLEQLDEALEAAPDAVLLDNMPPEILREAVRRNRGRATLEASGGISLETARAVAGTGVDLISVGALTHSPLSFDAALDFSF
jgi:nicotinate-nucleotide pyrophosphorylase (carboxylating)